MSGSVAIDLRIHSGPDLGQGYLAKLNRKVSDVQVQVSLVADGDEDNALGFRSDDSEGVVTECCLSDDDDRAELDL